MQKIDQEAKLGRVKRGWIQLSYLFFAAKEKSEMEAETM